MLLAAAHLEFTEPILLRCLHGGGLRCLLLGGGYHGSNTEAVTLPRNTALLRDDVTYELGWRDVKCWVPHLRDIVERSVGIMLLGRFGCASEQCYGGKLGSNATYFVN